MAQAQISTFDLSVIEKKLINEKNFVAASGIDNLELNYSGIYCIRFAGINKFPDLFDSILSQRQHNIIYIGSAKDSFKKRLLKQELRAKGHGTFFRSLGAVLGYRPPQSSLINKSNKYNYQFSDDDKVKIIKWINENLFVNWIRIKGDFGEFEKFLINRYAPLLNIKNNPLALPQLMNLRNECCQIAKLNSKLL